MTASLLPRLLTDAHAEGATIVRPVAGGSLGPSPEMHWLTVLVVEPDPRDGLDRLYHFGEGCPYHSRCHWLGQHDPAGNDDWALLEAHLTLDVNTPTEQRHWLLVPFDEPFGIHHQVLRDTLDVDWLILVDADDRAGIAAYERADLQGLEAAATIDLPNPSTAPLRTVPTPNVALRGGRAVRHAVRGSRGRRRWNRRKASR